MSEAEPHDLEERFLVLAPTGRDAPLTCALLAKAEMRCDVCRDVEELCTRFEVDGGAGLLIAEEVLVPRAFVVLSEMLARQAAWSDLPVLVFTGKSEMVGRRQGPSAGQLASLGNLTLLERPLQPLTMVSAARAALRVRRRQYLARAELHEQQRAVRQRDQFLAMLGHELRNPLSAIAMAIGLEQGSAPTREGQILRRQVAHMTRLVDDLLDVSRVTSGKVTLRRQGIDLPALVQRCVGQLSPRMHTQSAIRLHAPDEPLYVTGDPVRLEQVFTNLLTNAVKYTSAEGRIDVELSATDDEVRVAVRDTGVGIAPDMLKRVFGLFTQVEETLDRSKGGLGIGLTLVRSLVELHGGTVEAASSGLGQGSVFTVRLPRGCASRTKASGGPATAPSEKGRAACHEVLIVEDNPDSRELLSMLLSRCGHRVHTAEDGPTGLAALLAKRPHVALVDIGLPGLDGYAVARRAREALGNSVYLVALTGYGQPSDRERALAAGFDLHLTKPVDAEHLQSLLDGPALAAAVVG